MEARLPRLMGKWTFSYTPEGPGEQGDNVMMLEICVMARRLYGA